MQLPTRLPIFPVARCILLPGNFLPLNVFEPRYLNLVEDAAAADRLIGMVQPRSDRTDDWPSDDSPPSTAPVYEVGCAGSIEEAARQPDGRIHLLLRGKLRFRIERELPMQRGYRRVEVSCEDFTDDLSEGGQPLDRRPLVELLERYGEKRKLDFDLDRLSGLPGPVLLNGICAALPFSAPEKQALLEAAGAAERQRLLQDLLAMEPDGEPPAGDGAGAN